MGDNRKLCTMMGSCTDNIPFSKEELIAHIDEDDRNFQKVIDIMRAALEDDIKLRRRLQSLGV